MSTVKCSLMLWSTQSSSSAGLKEGTAALRAPSSLAQGKPSHPACHERTCLMLQESLSGHFTPSHSLQGSYVVAPTPFGGNIMVQALGYAAVWD